MAKRAARAKATGVRETAPKYRTRSTPESLGEAFWQAFQALPEEARGAFLTRLLEDAEMREDIYDTIIMIERRGEPTRLFEDFVAELKRDGLL